MRNTLLFFALVGATMVASGPTYAGAIYKNPAACTTINCQALTMGASVIGHGTQFSARWDQQLYAHAGECLRLDVVSQTEDLEMVVTAPAGAVYRNDDKGGAPCPNCSLVRIVAPQTGWYSVSIGQFAGVSVDADFFLAYGRYNSGTNPNCASPTPPTGAVRSAAKVSAPSPRPPAK